MRWTLDTDHSSIDFAVRHMAIATVRGRFRSFEGTVETREDGTIERVEVTIDAASIDTGVKQRDDHLRSPDFLDAASHPTLTYRATRAQPLGGGRHRVEGELTIRGVTQPVPLEIEVTPAVKDPWGNTRAAATGTGSLDRTRFGLAWNQALEMGGVLVANEVKFTVEVEAVAGAGAEVGV
ncbi:MAG TPA: YceI family protein [Gemmatimonadaceae bacterium]|nr:YceI family protein [Gemmatimonadaceae bacterium]